jgi:hypothetical protein
MLRKRRCCSQLALVSSVLHGCDRERCDNSKNYCDQRRNQSPAYPHDGDIGIGAASLDAELALAAQRLTDA